MTSHHHPSLARSRRKVSFTNLAVIHQLTGPSGSHKRTKRSKHSGGGELKKTRDRKTPGVFFLFPYKLRGFTFPLFFRVDLGIYAFHFFGRPFFFLVCSCPL